MHLHRKVATAAVMAALWPALKILEAWAWWVDRNEKRRGTPWIPS